MTPIAVLICLILAAGASAWELYRTKSLLAAWALLFTLAFLIPAAGGVSHPTG